MPYAINKLCTRCGACLEECPTGSISDGPDKFLIDADTCAEHKACVAVCPVDAIILLEASAKKDPVPDTSEEEEV